MSRPKTIFIAEMDVTELTLRIAEAACDFKRPVGRTAASCLAELRANDPQTTASFDRIARVTAEYFASCIRNGSQPS